MKKNVLSVKLTRALPTVGCEADAIVGETILDEYATESGCGFPNGSYAAVPNLFDPKNLTKQFSICIMHPDDNNRERARLHFGRVDEEVSRVSVVLECWDSVYCDGAILPGCGGADSSFANEERATSSDAEGSWKASTTRLYLHRNNVTERHGFVTGIEEINGRTELNGLKLPRGLMIRILPQSEGNNESIVEAAWFVDHKRAVVRAKYLEARLTCLEHSVEVHSRVQ